MIGLLVRASLVASLLCQAVPAGAQSIASQPLPPPPGTAKAAATAPAAHKPSAVPVVTAPNTAVRKTPPPAKPVTKSVVKPIVKSGAKPPVTPKPAATAPVPATPTPPVATAPRPDPTKGSSTGLPLPRWVALRADEVNLRTGPGTQYPIDWVYHRRDYPVQVLREFEIWRLIQEQDGTKGWVHQATLTGRRGFVVTGGEQVLRASAEDTADPVARLAAGVVGHIRKCPTGSAWCEVQTGDYRGWLKRETMYGVSADEVIE